MQHVDLSPLPSGKLAMDSTAARIPMSSWSLLRLLLLLLASSSADRSFSLPDDCPTGCGNINVTYPFGLKDGCSFRPGFNLFCNTSAHPPKLFLGNDTTTQVLNVTSFHDPFVAIKPLSRVFNISSRDDQSTTWEETISWTMPGGDGMPYAISSDNSVTVVGCGVRAFLIDGGTNESLDNCTSTCTDVDSIGACHYDLGEGCCKMSFPYERYLLKSFKIRLTLLNETQPSSTANFSSVVKILVASDYIPTDDPPRSYVGYHFKRRDLYDTKNISIDNGQFLLDWAILDERTCTRDNSNNVCDLSDNSHCRNSSTPGFGYNCFCGYWDEDLGNPYIPHGCKGKKPISTDLVGEERNLTINFLRAANENRHFDLMDARVKVEGATKELEDVAKLACMCISFERNSRPTMKEVEYTLQILLRERKKTQEYKEDIDESRILVSSNASHGVSMVNNPNQDNEDPTQNYSMVKHLLSTIDFPR